MLGHKLLQFFADKFETATTLRSPRRDFEKYKLLPPDRIIENLDLTDFAALEKAVNSFAPQVMVNAAGVVKQNARTGDETTIWKTNAELPHKLAEIAETVGSRLICLSTDCVFDGRRGSYSESEPPNAFDLYGASKIAGEVSRKNCLTVRTSMIGRELSGSHGLLEWFLSQQNGTVKGFRKAVFSGFPTVVLAEILAGLIENQPALDGIYHLAAEPVNKFDLLGLIKKRFDLDVEIVPADEPEIDRSLNGEKFQAAVNFSPPDWEEMINKMADDSFPYAAYRNENTGK